MSNRQGPRSDMPRASQPGAGAAAPAFAGGDELHVAAAHPSSGGAVCEELPAAAASEVPCREVSLAKPCAVRAEVSGIVQGVGFRPYLHRLAKECRLSGWARNTSLGVELFLEGDSAQIERFFERLEPEAPFLAVISSVKQCNLTREEATKLREKAVHAVQNSDVKCAAQTLAHAAEHTVGGADALTSARDAMRFHILESADGAHDTLISPDVCTCSDCLRELRDPASRRYRYPFINCTNCGPRFTITKTVPYDRKNTTMAPFALCPSCAAEYADISDRRYHAQPDCCPVCGPKLSFWDGDGREVEGDAILHAQQLLLGGGILAVKGLGGFHLAALPRADVAEVLRRRKHRDEKPFALMCPDADAAARLCEMSGAERALLESFRRPIVLLKKRADGGENIGLLNGPCGDVCKIANACDRGNTAEVNGKLRFLSETNELGIMLPYTPLHSLLFDPVPGNEADGVQCTVGEPGCPKYVFPALILTSANLSDCPVLSDNAEAAKQLHGIADGFLVHDRAIDARCDDSLYRVLAVRGAEYPLRRSRGYAPQPLFTSFDADGILALGAEQKASFTLGKGHSAFCSQHIGDLKNAETLAHYESQIGRFERLFGAKPRQLVCDLHPDYLSTEYAKQRAACEKLPLLAVQHHWAHMASCMADNDFDGPCIGVVWDGTGLGTDETVWGGEFLTGDCHAFRRRASLRPVPLLGGDKAAKEIGRIAFALLWDAWKDAPCDEEAFAARVGFSETETALFTRMLSRGINCPQSAGMGRLFDGVYALLTGRRTVSYEGQGAVLLETLADPVETGCLPVCFYEDDAPPLCRFDPRPLIRALCREQAAGVAAPALAAKFHNTLVEMAVRQCLALHAETGLSAVCLTGGVFQNSRLVNALTQRLEAEGFKVLLHRRTACNDEGLSLGQLAIAAAQRYNKKSRAE